MEVLDRSVKTMSNQREEEIAGIFSAHYDKVYNLCSRMCLNRSLAQDVTQEVFIKVFRNLDDFRGQARISTWIYSIAVRQCIDHIRSEKRAVEKIARLLGFSTRRETSLEEDIVARHLGSQILAKMSPTNRALLVLRAYMGLNYEEIGSTLSMTPAGVGVQLSRARKEALKIAQKEGIADAVQGF
jgi:RNA polymerase sigma-70 factor, ECF subfamily